MADLNATTPDGVSVRSWLMYLRGTVRQAGLWHRANGGRYRIADLPAEVIELLCMCRPPEDTGRSTPWHFPALAAPRDEEQGSDNAAPYARLHVYSTGNLIHATCGRVLLQNLFGDLT